MASLPQSATTTPFAAPALATSLQNFIVQYMNETQVDPHDKIPRPPNAYMIFKRYYQWSPTATSTVAWISLGAYERGLFIDAAEAAKALHRQMYAGYKFQPKSKGGDSRVKRSHALNASVIPVNYSAPSTSTAPAPSFFALEHPMQEDYHAHHYGYTDDISDMANNLVDSCDMADVATYLVENFENMLADVHSGF